jgi:hypothetical protein
MVIKRLVIERQVWASRPSNREHRGEKLSAPASMRARNCSAMARYR